MGREIKWEGEGGFAAWVLTNCNTTRYPGGVCIDNKANGNGIIVSPITEATAMLDDGWRDSWVRATVPLGTGLEFWFRVGTDDNDVEAHEWLGPYDHVDAETELMWTNMHNEIAKNNGYYAKGKFQIKIVILPS